MNQALIGQLYAGFFERYGDQIAPEHREVCERLVASFDGYLAGEAAPQRAHGLGARRLSAGQHAVRRARRRPPADGGRLADRVRGVRR